MDDIPNVSPPASVKAQAPQHRVRGVACSSDAFPSHSLYLSQVNPDDIVDPAEFFLQLGKGLPSMRAANVHIQDRIRQLYANPPTMDQDVVLVPDGRSFEPYV